MSNLLDNVCNVDWNANCNLARPEEATFINAEKSLVKLAQWSKQIENIYQDNLALPFIREAQVSAQDFCCLISLGLYKVSASSLRTILESFLYFSYFKDHEVELRTLSLADSYYISKKEIIDYHGVHTLGYKKKSQDLGFTGDLEKFYKKISSIVHGQLPGVWHSSSCLSDKTFDKTLTEEAVSDFVELVAIINIFMLMLISDEDWLNLDNGVKRNFQKGLSSKIKETLKRH